MNEIIEVIFACQGFVFGGYVRDMLSGDVPNDIDCCIPNYAREVFWKDLLNHFGSFTVTKMQDYKNLAKDFYGYNTLNKMSLQRIIVRDIQVDIVDHAAFMPNCPDCDVNMLKLTKTGIELMDRSLNLASVLKNIRMHQASFFPTCRPCRAKKMQNKCWNLI